MLIKKQDKTEIEVLKRRDISLCGNIVLYDFPVNDHINGILLGSYYTKKRAREVRHDLFTAYGRGDRVYEMPEA